MTLSLCITFRFIHPHPLFHGRGDADVPEWPPSPMRAFQALLSAACQQVRGRPLTPAVRSALQTIEGSYPAIIAPRVSLTVAGHRAYVPHNQTDLVTAAWHRGNNEESIAKHRVEKDYRPHRMEMDGDELPAVHYLYPLESNVKASELLAAILPAVRSIHCLGWGIDQVVADATLIDARSSQLVGEGWKPTPRGGQRLRVPRSGSLEALLARHDRFLNRLVEGNWTPVPPLSDFDLVQYRRDTDPAVRPYVVFKLMDENDDTVSYSPSRFIHVAGMVRHAAIQVLTRNPPRDLRGRAADEWLDTYVAGHRPRDDEEARAAHSQFSYVPLQSIGHTHADPGVRRVMIVAPLGDEAWLEHLAARLDGVPLSPLPRTNLPTGTRLERFEDARPDGVRDAYLRRSHEWASVTPVILPGHDDHKSEKTRKLIQKALQQSGIDQPCEFEWSAFSRFRKSLPAHRYRRDAQDPAKKIQINYVRPSHLLDQTAVHLTVRFLGGTMVPGPLTIGAGRHCGFGVMADISANA